MPLNGTGLGPRANLPRHSTKLTFSWSSVQYIVCIQLLLYAIKSEEQIEKFYFFFLTNNHKLRSQEVYAVAQQRILHAFVFMSCKTVFLPSAADR